MFVSSMRSCALKCSAAMWHTLEVHRALQTCRATLLRAAFIHCFQQAMSWLHHQLGYTWQVQLLLNPTPFARWHTSPLTPSGPGCSTSTTSCTACSTDLQCTQVRDRSAVASPEKTAVYRLSCAASHAAYQAVDASRACSTYHTLQLAGSVVWHHLHVTVRRTLFAQWVSSAAVVRRNTHLTASMHHLGLAWFPYLIPQACSAEQGLCCCIHCPMLLQKFRRRSFG